MTQAVVDAGSLWSRADDHNSYLLLRLMVVTTCPISYEVLTVLHGAVIWTSTISIKSKVPKNILIAFMPVRPSSVYHICKLCQRLLLLAIPSVLQILYRSVWRRHLKLWIRWKPIHFCHFHHSHQSGLGDWLGKESRSLTIINHHQLNMVNHWQKLEWVWKHVECHKGLLELV